MVLFSTEVFMNYIDDRLDLNFLGVKTIEELDGMEKQAFSVGSLGIFNHVTATFKLREGNRISIKFELKRTHYKLQFFAFVVIILGIIGGVVFHHLQTGNVSPLVILFIPGLLIAYLFYQKDFNKEVKEYCELIMLNWEDE